MAAFRLERQAIGLAVASFPTDVQLAELCETFRVGNVAEQRLMKQAWYDHDPWDYAIFAQRMANKAVRERELRGVLDGMTAMCIDGERFDMGCSLGCAAMLRCAADHIGAYAFEQCLKILIPIADNVPCKMSAMKNCLGVVFDDRALADNYVRCVNHGGIAQFVFT